MTCFKQTSTAQLQEFDCSNGSFTYTLDDFNNVVSFEIRDQDGRVEFFSPANQLRGPTSSPVRFVNCDVVETTTRSASGVNTLLANHNTVCFGGGGQILADDLITIPYGKSLVSLEGIKNPVSIENAISSGTPINFNTNTTSSSFVGFRIFENTTNYQYFISIFSSSDILIDDIEINMDNPSDSKSLVYLASGSQVSFENSRLVTASTSASAVSINDSSFYMKNSLIECQKNCINFEDNASNRLELFDGSAVLNNGQDLNTDYAVSIYATGTNTQINISDSEIRVGAAKGIVFDGSSGGNIDFNFISSRLVKMSDDISIALDVPTSGPSSLNLNFSPDSQICTIDPNDSFSDILFNPSSVPITENLENMATYISNTATPVCVD